MSNGPFVKIRVATAAEICAHFDLKDDTKPLLRDGIDPRQFVIMLLENNKCIDAIHFMAHALPPREAIWWGCLCIQHALGDELTPADRAAATAAVRWVTEPTEDSRMAAKAPADGAPIPSAAGTLALAAFYTGGNVAPPGLPPMSPEPFASARAVALAVTLASVKAEPRKIVKTQKAYVELAAQVAEGSLI
jgi:hypothetical protein